MLRNLFFSSQIFGILELLHLSFNFTICLIFICRFIFLLIIFHIPLCYVRQPYKGCPFTCNLAEITRNEYVWRMRTNNVKRVYYFMINLHESMGPDQERTCNPWICSQTCICSQTRYQLCVTLFYVAGYRCGRTINFFQNILTPQ